MCEFISWIEYKDEILFLTKKELETSRGKELRKHLGMQFYHDVKGHGAIEWYYELGANVGRHRECTDFSEPENFPAIIVKAIKHGDFCGIGIPENLLCGQESLLNGQALAEYRKAEGKIWAEFDKARGQAFWKIAKKKDNRRKEWR